MRVLLLFGAIAPVAEAAIVLVTCRGIHKMSDERAQVDCAESYTLSDPQGGLMTGYSTALSSLTRGALAAGAAGGVIRDASYHGRKASSILLDTVTATGAWRGAMPITVSLRVQFGFGGYGVSRLDAIVRSALPRNSGNTNQARVRIQHTALGAATLVSVDSTGNFKVPGDDAYPSAATIDLLVTQLIEPDSPTINLRADLYAYALPNLSQLESTTSSIVNAEAHVRVSSPCPVKFRSGSGVFLADDDAGWSGPALWDGADPTWVCSAEP